MKSTLLTFVFLIQCVIVVRSDNPSPPTTGTGPKTCPEKQSAFYKDDLNQLIDYVEKKMKVLSHLNESFYWNVTNIANDLMLDLNAYLTELQKQPSYLMTTLDDIKSKREKTIVPLVKTAAVTLNELSHFQNEMKKLAYKSGQLLNAEHKAKQFCKYACDNLYRTLDVNNNSGVINGDDYLCSTLPEVLNYIKIRLSLFMEAETKDVYVYVNNTTHEINESIHKLKENLSEASKRILGVSMANVLYLQHDVIQAIESIEDFNAQSYEYSLGLLNANISLLHLEFKNNILLYRKECVKCNASLRIDVPRKRLPKPNILDMLLDEKVTELQDEIHEIIRSIFSDLNTKINDDLVKKTIVKLKPLVKIVAMRTTHERKYFDIAMQYAPKKDRMRMAILHNGTKIMLSVITKENNKIKALIHHLL